MHEDYNLNVETFDPKESIAVSNAMPKPARPALKETIKALVRAFDPSATLGFTMREAEAVGLIYTRGTFRERMARRALKAIGCLRHFRKHPQTAFTDMFKDNGRRKVTQRCRNIAAAALGSKDQTVRVALSKPITDLPPQPNQGTAAVFDAYRNLVTQ